MSPPDKQTSVIRKGEYERHGDFHRELDPNWGYYPIYLNKIRLVDEFLQKYGGPDLKTLDAGCGEGVLVERYAGQGWDIVGIDKNYQSEYVREGSLTAIPFRPDTFDTLLCLDVLEHLPLDQQPVGLYKLRKVLKPGGYALFSVPNLAHFTARLKFLFRGRLLRTASITHHPGDRPASEYKALLEKYDFKVVTVQGIFPTVPPLYRFVTTHPAQSTGLLRFLQRLPFPVFWNFQTLFICQMVKTASNPDPNQT